MTGMCCYLSFIPRGFSTEKIGPKGLISATVAGVALSESLLEEVTVGIRAQVGHPSRFPRRQGLGSWPLPPSVSFVLQMTSARINSVHQWDSKPISIPKGRFSHSSPTTFELCPPRSLGSPMGSPQSVGYALPYICLTTRNHSRGCFLKISPTAGSLYF